MCWSAQQRIEIKLYRITAVSTAASRCLFRVEPLCACYSSGVKPLSLFLRQNHEQESGESDLTKNAFKILYATDEDHDQAAEGEEPLEADQAQVTVGAMRCNVYTANPSLPTTLG